MINGNERDKAPFEIANMRIDYVSKYLYLGAWFTDSGKISDVIALHEQSNQATLNKFAIFCAANRQMPFKYKLVTDQVPWFWSDASILLQVFVYLFHNFILINNK